MVEFSSHSHMGSVWVCSMQLFCDNADEACLCNCIFALIAKFNVLFFFPTDDVQHKTAPILSIPIDFYGAMEISTPFGLFQQMEKGSRAAIAVLSDYRGQTEQSQPAWGSWSIPERLFAFSRDTEPLTEQSGDAATLRTESFRKRRKRFICEFSTRRAHTHK